MCFLKIYIYIQICILHIYMYMYIHIYIHTCVYNISVHKYICICLAKRALPEYIDWVKCVLWLYWDRSMYTKHLGVTRSSRLQHTATHCNTLQHTATHCNTMLRNLLLAYDWFKKIAVCLLRPKWVFWKEPYLSRVSIIYIWVPLKSHIWDPPADCHTLQYEAALLTLGLWLI